MNLISKSRRRAVIGAALVVSAALLTGCAPRVSVAWIETLDPVGNLEVDVEIGRSSRTHLDLTLHNRGTENLRVLWDESSYTNQNGEAHRLVASYQEQPMVQPPSPLPAGSSIREICWVGYSVVDRRADVDQATGTLTLVLARDDERLTWRGVLHLDVTDPTRSDGTSRPRKRPTWD